MATLGFYGMDLILAILSTLLTLGLIYLLTFLTCTLAIPNTIEKQNVVIIGASSGIGKELSLIYKQRGFNQVIVARRRELLEKLQDEKTLIYVADMTNYVEMEKLIEFVKLKLGSCDTLIINAGILSQLLFEDVSVDLVNQVFQVNAISPIICAKLFIPLLKQTKGRIVVVSSAAGVMAAPTRSLYCATKHALNGFFNSLRIELEPFNVSVTIVMPGSVNTELRSKAIDKPTQSRENGMDPKVCAEKIVQASDKRKRWLFIPFYYQIGAILNFIMPSVIDGMAKRKYKTV